MKKTPKKAVRRKSDVGLVAIKGVELSLNLTPSAARELRSNLETMLGGAKGGIAQLHIEARELNEIYVYVGVGHMKKIIARLAEIAP